MLRVFCVWMVMALASPLMAQGGDDGEIWLVQQQFVKFGKKELYESTKKAYMQSFGSFLKKKSNLLTYAFEDLNSPQYIYLTPLKNYAGVDDYLAQKRAHFVALSVQDKEMMVDLLQSITNFEIFSIHQYKLQCSYVPKGDADLLSRSRVHYEIFALIPGTEEYFEGRLKQMSEQARQAKSQQCWRVWKAALGSDVPKYIVATFAKDEAAMKQMMENLEFIQPKDREILRKQSHSTAIARSDLSISDR